MRSNMVAVDFFFFHIYSTMQSMYSKARGNEMRRKNNAQNAMNSRLYGVQAQHT